MKKLTITFLFLGLFAMQLMMAQTRKVSGVVSAESDGSTFPGVTVVVKGTTIGTITNIDGYYEIQVPADKNILVFSFVGMQTEEIPIDGRSEINVSMKEGVIGLDEVLVVGYGSQIKSELTGSISKVKGQDIDQLPVPTVESALQGRTAGVFIENSSGKLGESMKVRIRGSSSISADNQPLYVVDGMVITSQNQGINTNSPTNPLADINPADIASIDILKDASAAAIYGSRAANGVVLITTKRGKAGATKINVNLQGGISEPSHLIDLMDAAEYRKFFLETFIRSYGDEATALAELNDYIPYFSGYTDENGNTTLYDVNWQKEAFQQGQIRQMDVTASGGDEKTKFYTGLTYNDQKGILLGNSLSRLSGRLNVDHSPGKKLHFTLNFGLTRSVMERVSDDNSFSTPLQMTALPPVQPKYDPVTGELFRNTIYENGLIPAKYDKFNTQVLRNLSNLKVSYELFSGLKFNTEFGLDVLNQREDNYLGRKTNDGGPAGFGESRALQVLNYSWDNYFNYSPVINDANVLEFVLGTTMQKSRTDINFLQAIGFPSDDFKTLVNATETVAFGSQLEQYSYLSYFSRANYKLLDKYLLTLSGRIDGSSRFGKNNRYGFFPAVSVGWIVSREAFMDALSTVSFLKLRASYGLTGNSEIGNFASLGLYQGANYAGQYGVRPFQLPSPDLRWETTAQTDVGLDFGFFKNRVSGEIDYYYKNTNDLLLNQPVLAVSGFTSVTKNIGSLENKGLEFVLNTVNLDRRLQWSTSFNIGFNKNKITNLAGLPIIAGVNRAEEGQPIGVFYMVKYAGVAEDDIPGGNPDGSDIYGGDALYYVKEGSDAVTSDYNLANPMIVGTPNPDFVGGLQNSFTYKGIDLSVMLQFVSGNSIYRTSGQWNSSNGWNLDNQLRSQLDSWKQPGDKTDVPRSDWDVNNGSRPSSRYLEDGSYLRLKSITLGYDFPETVSTRLKLSSLRVYVTAINLYTWTNYNGWDPEVNYPGAGRTQTTANLIQGNEFYTTPQARTVTVGLNLGF